MNSDQSQQCDGASFDVLHVSSSSAWNQPASSRSRGRLNHPDLKSTAASGSPGPEDWEPCESGLRIHVFDATVSRYPDWVSRQEFLLFGLPVSG